MNHKPDADAQESTKSPIAATLDVVLVVVVLTGTAAVVEFLRGRPVVRAALLVFVTAIATQAFLLLWPIVVNRVGRPPRTRD